MISPEMKGKLKGDGIMLGTFIKLGSPAVIEALGESGLDFFIIDTEHAPYDQIQLENIIRAADCVNLPTIVRVPIPDDINILKALDLGASGVQLPNLETVEEVNHAIKATKYAPKGRRGLSFTQRSAKYGIIDKKEYIGFSNKYLLNVVHIENKYLASNVEKLCMIEDVDVLFIGPMDLSQSFGHPGEPSLPEIQETIRNIICICKKYNKVSGIYVNTFDEVRKYKKLGVKYFALGSDIGFLLKGIKDTISLI